MKIIFTFFVTFISLMALELGTIPSVVVLRGENGGKLDETAWSSQMLKDKVYVVFYVDPDKKDLNNALAEALKSQKFDRNAYGSVAIINLAATWMPNFVLEKKLKQKQEKFPDTLYVKDKKKVLLRAWDLADDDSDVLVFDKDGKLIYQKFGQLNDMEIKEVVRLIDEKI